MLKNPLVFQGVGALWGVLYTPGAPLGHLSGHPEVFSDIPGMLLKSICVRQGAKRQAKSDFGSIREAPIPAWSDNASKNTLIFPSRCEPGQRGGTCAAHWISYYGSCGTSPVPSRVTKVSSTPLALANQTKSTCVVILECHYHNDCHHYRWYPCIAIKSQKWQCEKYHQKYL